MDIHANDFPIGTEISVEHETWKVFQTSQGTHIWAMVI